MKLSFEEKVEAFKSIGTFEIVAEKWGYHFRRSKPIKTEWVYVESDYYHPMTLINNWWKEMFGLYGGEDEG